MIITVFGMCVVLVPQICELNPADSVSYYKNVWKILVCFPSLSYTYLHQILASHDIIVSIPLQTTSLFVWGHHVSVGVTAPKCRQSPPWCKVTLTTTGSLHKLTTIILMVASF